MRILDLIKIYVFGKPWIDEYPGYPSEDFKQRAALLERLRDELRETRGDDAQSAVLMIDIDDLTAINRLRGRFNDGDEVLAALPDRVSDAAGSNALVTRWSSDEFVAICHAGTSQGAQSLAENVRHAVAERPFMTDAGPLAVTVSIGAVMLDRNMTELENIEAASAALRRGRRPPF